MTILVSPVSQLLEHRFDETSVPGHVVPLWGEFDGLPLLPDSELALKLGYRPRLRVFLNLPEPETLYYLGITFWKLTFKSRDSVWTSNVVTNHTPFWCLYHWWGVSEARCIYTNCPLQHIVDNNQRIR